MKFYEDPTYIEMCRKAGEIQAARKYEVGDFFDHNIGTIIFGSGFDNNESCRDTSAIWLPRLDQLIDMLDWTEPLDAQTYKMEYNAIEGPKSTWETMFIQMVMRQNHGKQWDFEKKEWVGINA